MVKIRAVHLFLGAVLITSFFLWIMGFSIIQLFLLNTGFIFISLLFSTHHTSKRMRPASIGFQRMVVVKALYYALVFSAIFYPIHLMLNFVLSLTGGSVQPITMYLFNFLIAAMSMMAVSRFIFLNPHNTLVVVSLIVVPVVAHSLITHQMYMALILPFFTYLLISIMYMAFREYFSTSAKIDHNILGSYPAEIIFIGDRGLKREAIPMSRYGILRVITSYKTHGNILITPFKKINPELLEMLKKTGIKEIRIQMPISINRLIKYYLLFVLIYIFLFLIV